MNKLRYIIGIVTIAILSACSEEEWLNNNQGKIIVEAGFANTRTTFVEDDGTTHVSWEKGDVIGLFTDKQTNLAYIAQNEGSSTEFKSSSEKLAATEGNKVYAYYPHDNNICNDGLKAPLPDITGQGHRNCDFLYAIGNVRNNKILFQFKHVFAFIKITLPLSLIQDRSDRSSLKIQSSNELVFDGEAYFDLGKEEIVYTETLNYVWYSIPSKEELENKQEMTCYIAILPQKEGSEIDVLFSKDGSSKNSYCLLTKTVPTGGFKAGNVYTLYIEKNESEGTEQRERDALIALYNATNGDNWINNDNWCSDKPLDEWYGVYTDFRGVESLGLENNNLCGIIPEEITNLTHLKGLGISYNSLKGLPENIGELNRLEVLDISGNEICQLPKSLEELVNLRILIAQHVGLKGTLPNFSKLKALEEIHLDYNSLSGEIPENIGNACALTHLSLTNNKICGKLPESLKELTQLEWVSVNNNLIEGNVPECFADMPNLQNLDLYANYFSGSVPAKLVQCDNWKFWLSHYDILPQNNGMLLIEENALYTSTDYSKDGEIFILQKHSIGNGVKLVLMGDFFVDTDMNPGGVYETKMKEAMEYYFSIEPFASLREYFDVIGIKAVSKHNQMNYESAFSTNTITSGSIFDSDKDKCMKLVQKAIGNDNLDDVSVIMVLNVFSPFSQADLFSENNFSIAYCPLDEMLQMDKYMVNHEANGHGFGLLADEYLSVSAEKDFTYGVDYYKVNYHKDGWFANVDSNPNPNEISWNHFINDLRYADEHIGVYEGANGYEKGLYKPTDNSIMHGNLMLLHFNAPSREAIYKRVMKLAYGDSWAYDYEEFVKFDKQGHNDFVNALNSIQTRNYSNSEPRKYKHNPPVIYDYPAVIK